MYITEINITKAPTQVHMFGFSENIKYRSLSDKNRLREWKIVPQRGIIEDYFGNKIATNTQIFQLHMLPEDVPNLEELFFRLTRLIDFNESRRKN